MGTGNKGTEWSPDSLRQMTPKNDKNKRISREIEPSPPTQLAGGVGWPDEKVLDVGAFLALRQLLNLAECLWIICFAADQI
jgi:hypothetical protein